ncbi:MAG: hypothetical protein WAN86_24370 [Hyphomicrobiaceae bacterium]
MTIAPRLISALVLTAFVAVLFWLAPAADLATFGATTPERTIVFFTSLFALYLAYLIVQGYPISHGQIGSTSAHNLDNIISGVPALAAVIGIFLHLVGFWPVSLVNLAVAALTLGVVAYDLLILGGAAAKINRLTDEFKRER